MNNYIMHCICLLITLLIMSCSNSNDNPLDKMEQIKEIGNENPKQALAMLDSIEIEIRDKNDYTKNKYDLLRIRLNDKADNMPTSDKIIKRLMFFSRKRVPILRNRRYITMQVAPTVICKIHHGLWSIFLSLWTMPSDIKNVTLSCCEIRTQTFIIYNTGCKIIPMHLRRQQRN